MASRTIYTRVYSNSSAGQLTSGRGPIGPPFSDDELLDEFQRHADLWNEIPTALVSVSSRIVDTVHRAFQKHQQDDESPADIWVVFIGVPEPQNGMPVPGLHSAQRLAEQCPHLDAKLFRYEFVFEWAIPANWAMHRVSLQALMNRGLEIPQVSKTKELRISLAREFQEYLDCPFELGIHLGSLAEKFGLEAPLNWIAHRWHGDCARIAQGVDEGIDWWLSDVEVRYYEDPEVSREYVGDLKIVAASKEFIALAVRRGLLNPQLVRSPILEA